VLRKFPYYDVILCIPASQCCWIHQYWDYIPWHIKCEFVPTLKSSKKNCNNGLQLLTTQNIVEDYGNGLTTLWWV